MKLEMFEEIQKQRDGVSQELNNFDFHQFDHIPRNKPRLIAEAMSAYADRLDELENHFYPSL